MKRKISNSMERRNGLTSSQQCYLAEILTLKAELGQARQSEIADRMGVNKSSVTAALRVLSERSLIEYEPYGAVTITSQGKQTAKTILARREIIKSYLVRFLHVSEDVAHDAACCMQYSVPDPILEKLSVKLRARPDESAT